MNGPYLLEVLLGRGTNNERWHLQQSCESCEEALRVASRMSSAYRYRLYCGPSNGYAQLEWIDDEDDTNKVRPVWMFDDQPA